MFFSAWSLFITFLWQLSTVKGQISYAVSGVQTGRGQNGTRPYRMNIYDLQQNQPQMFNLYIQGLLRMQQASPNDQLSWLQVVGVHGRPYAPWNDDQQMTGAPTTGYCTHSSPLFATWHRPYLATIEQVLALHIQEIAKLYPLTSRQAYKDAADRWRLPYWDWAANYQLPPVITTSNIHIETPEGPRTLKNPLYSYRFPSPLDRTQFPPNQDGGLSTYAETSRDSAAVVNDRLRRENFRSRAYSALTRSNSFNVFSTASNPGTSIEAVHNSVHGDVNRHMGSLAYSAFDPLFWLHHTNVDRITALYQCIHPDRWLTSAAEPQGTFTIRQGQTVDGATELKPFTFNTRGQYYTSDSSRYLNTFGYSYPEIQDWNQTPTDLQRSCTAHISRLYNPPTPNQTPKHKRSIRRRYIPSLQKRVAEQDEIRTWTVSIKVSKFDYPEPFIVRAFISEPASKDSNEQVGGEAYLGSFYVNQPGDRAYYISTNRDVVVYDEYDIRRELWERGVDGQSVEDTSAFLKRDLGWMVLRHDGAIIPLEQIKSLTISVAEEMVTPARSESELPTYGKRVLHPEITREKVGGFTGRAAG